MMCSERFFLRVLGDEFLCSDFNYNKQGLSDVCTLSDEGFWVRHEHGAHMGFRKAVPIRCLQILSK